MGEKKTKEDWCNHIRNTIEITNSCVVNHIPCSDCVDIFGPCRKNIAINKFGNLVEQVLDRKGNKMAIEIGNRVMCITYPAARGTVIKQYYPTASAQQTMIRCDDGKLFHAPTAEFVKI